MQLETVKSLTRQEQFVALYERSFPKVAALVRRSGGSFDDAKDVFQDALIVLYEQQGDRAIENESAYVAGIARHLWLKKLRERSSLLRLDEVHPDVPEATAPQVSASLLRFVERSGKRCLELLKSFYYDRTNMQELAEQFGFSGERSATAQKYKCLEKVRNAVQQRNFTKTDFYE